MKLVEGEIEVVEDGLPHDYKPVPKEEWISPAPDPLPESEIQARSSSIEDASSEGVRS